MKIEVNIQKKHLLVFIGLLVFVLGGVFVYAAWNAPAAWHDASGVRVASCFGSVDNLESCIGLAQRRVTGTCLPGSSIRVIDSNGGVTCETDDVGSGGGSSSGTVVGGGTNGYLQDGNQYNCASWGSASCTSASSNGQITCPSTSQKKLTGIGPVGKISGSSAQLASNSYICVQN